MSLAAYLPVESNPFDQHRKNFIYFPDRKRFALKQKHVVVVFIAALIVGLVVALYFLFRPSTEDVTHRGAIVTNGLECSEMARQILDDGGTVADAAITALLCEGVTCPQSTGIGGGFVMTIFIAATGKLETLNAREIAPGQATQDMFMNTTSVKGGKAIAVPGEMKGYWELHKKYGKLEWSQLFKPVIALCRHGHEVTEYLANILTLIKPEIVNSPSLAKIYINPATNDVYKRGDFVKRLQLADTLEEIAEKGAATLYENGTLAQRLIEDIRQEGGIMTVEDLMAYRVQWGMPASRTFENNKTLHSFSLPGSGALVIFMINALNNYLPDGPVLRSYQRIVETFKYAYAQRTLLGDFTESEAVVRNLTNVDYAMHIRDRIEDNRTHNDPKYYGGIFEQVNDHGTANINILATNGDAISVTGSINNIFGSKIHSNRTGIILNDSMDDFSIPGRNNGFGLPPSPANFIRPYHRPLSSMCPTILLDEHGKVELLIGAAGGSRITSSVAYVLMRYLYFNESIWNAVHAPRIHHQLLPMQITYERTLVDDLVTGLESFGHKMVRANSDFGFASLTAIGRDGNRLVPVYDPRRLGSTSVF